jgi:hypothetical protein
MKLSEFILLNEEEKKWAVLHGGTLVGKRNNPDYMVFLFQLDSYYVETYCNRTSKAIEEFMVFENTCSLEPYLQSIQIDHLIN